MGLPQEPTFRINRMKRANRLLPDWLTTSTRVGGASHVEKSFYSQAKTLQTMWGTKRASEVGEVLPSLCPYSKNGGSGKMLGNAPRQLSSGQIRV
jgi:hypothetical protein